MKLTVLILSCCALLTACVIPATAQEADHPPIPLTWLPLQPDVGFVGEILQHPQAGCNPAWIGHAPGTFLGVGEGSTWRFNQDIAGTDSSQGWVRWELPYRYGAYRPAASRPEWAYDYGNSVNNGNKNLEDARILAGRKFVRRGVAGVWHRDTMTGVKRNVADGAEPSSTPIAGVSSAWCGLRESGNLAAIDALTGNPLNGDLQLENHGIVNRPEFPGYANQWDQMLYKDFASPGTGTVSFRVRTEMSTFIDPVTGGSGWFNPDPTNLANFVNNTADTFMVYVGSPNETAYDSDRRWLSEVLDLSKPVKEIFAVSGIFPAVAADTAIARTYADVTPIGGNVRVVFRVKTNRVRSDETTNSATGYNSKAGAAIVDNVAINGGVTYGFETAGSITARSLIPNLATVGGAWATTGRPPSSTFHIEHVMSLIYEDLNGAIGSPTRLCNLNDVVWVAGDHDNSEVVPVEHYQAIESPTINLANRTAPAGDMNSQGITGEMSTRPSILLQYDWYSGFMSTNESIYWQVGVRFHGPAMTSPVSGMRQWSAIVTSPFVSMNPFPICQTAVEDLSALGEVPGSIDSLRVLLLTQSQAFYWGGTNLGNTRGTYFDNVSVGLYDPSLSTTNCPHGISPVIAGGGPGTGPALQLPFWAKLQDTFPSDESVAPGDNAAFDNLTALMTSSLNIVTPVLDPGVVAGDSMLAFSTWTGNGTTTGTRVDLVFRIDPGPGSYVVKGNRTTALVNRDAAHPFYASYLADNGPFGTPGGHGPTWNRDVWNSCRIDSAELNVHPILSRGIGGPANSTWMSTIHEQDPKYAQLGITHNVCYLIDPNGRNDESNITCDGTVPAVYGGLSGTTKEGTKVLPDGWFTPGTHIEYYVRSSFVEDPSSYNERPDTRFVYPHDFGPFEDRDAERFAHVDVLPDMWKSLRYGGQGLACMLIIDAADRRGSNPAYRGAADSLGYGKTNGASKGWQRTGATVAAHETPNAGSDYIDANLGQFGLSYDQFDIGGAEANGSGRLGTRLALNTGAISGKQARQGPSQAMLEAFYNTIVWASGDLQFGTMHDGERPSLGSNDVAMIRTFLANADVQSRALWLSGDGIMEDAFNNSLPQYSLLTEDCGTDLGAPNRKVWSGTLLASEAKFHPVAPWSQVGETYGISQDGPVASDVLLVVPTVSFAQEAAQYENEGPSPWTASVWRPGEPGRPYRTLVDGFDLSHLRTHWSANDLNLSHSNVGRLIWAGRVLDLGLQTCLRKGPVVAVGDIPGDDGGDRFTTRLAPARPNPVPTGARVRFDFTLQKAQEVRLRIYTVSGRQVATIEAQGKAGVNAIEWNRRSDDGVAFAAGVYLYALEAGGVPVPGDRRKLVLLGP